MEAQRALREMETFCRHDDKRGEGPSAGLLAIATVTVKHQNRFGFGFVANRAASASARERCGYLRHILFCVISIFITTTNGATDSGHPFSIVFRNRSSSLLSVHLAQGLCRRSFDWSTVKTLA